MNNRVTNLDEVYKPLHYKKLDVPLGYYESSSYHFNVDVDYQRDHVWTQEQRENFMGYVLSGNGFPPCWANTGVYGDLEFCEVVDGKQRITSAMMWYKGEICARTSNGLEVWYHDLDGTSQRRVRNGINIVFHLVRLDRKGVLDLYLRLNSGGTVHTQEELNKVRELLKEENETRI